MVGGADVDPADDRKRLRHNLLRGTVRAEHLIVATSGGGTDVGRLALYTHPDGATVAYGFRVAPQWAGVEELYSTLLNGLEGATRSTGLERIEVSVVDGDRLDLQAMTEGLELTGEDSDPLAETIREIDPSDPEVLLVMAAATGYRDMMADSRLPVPWLAHREPDGIDGILAIQAYPTDWCLGYLAVAPDARRTVYGTNMTLSARRLSIAA